MEKLVEMKELIEKLIEDDAYKFYQKGVKAAAPRIRKQMQTLKDMAQQVRVEVQELKNKG